MSNIFHRLAHHARGSGFSLSKLALTVVLGVIAVASTRPAVAQSWPVVPVNTSGLKLAAPLPTAPPNDLFQKGALPAGVRGTLLYTPMLYHVPGSQTYLILRGIGVTRAIAGQQTAIASYRSNLDIVLFDPQFSPDGKRILFKEGAPFESYGSYSLYLWDTMAGSLRAVTDHREAINFNEVFWSPDGNSIAYVRGGDMAGREGRNTKQIHLRILDLQKGKSRRVVKNRGTTDMAWTQQGTLLFTMLPKNPNIPEEQEKEEDKAEGPEPEAPAVPSIYEAAAKGGAVKRIIENGYNPAPSPDGRWIAFLDRPQAAGKADPKAADATVAPPALYLYDRVRKERIPVGSEKVDFLLWTPDSRSLLVIKTAYMGVQGGSAKGEAYISLVNPVTLGTRQVATLEGYDYRPFPGRNITSRLFTPMKFSRDGRFLFVRAEEITGPGASPSFNAVRKTLQAVNLASGQVAVVAQFNDDAARVLGFDWHDETGTTTSLSSSSVSASSTSRPRGNAGSANNTGNSSTKRNGGR